MPAWLNAVAEFLWRYGPVISPWLILAAHVVLSYYNYRRFQGLEKERAANDRDIRTELHRLGTKQEIDTAMRRSLEECWRLQASAFRKKLAVYYVTDVPRIELLGQLSEARSQMKNAFFDSLYVPQSLVERMKAFDALLADRGVQPPRLHLENSRLRREMRRQAGLPADEDEAATGPDEVTSPAVERDLAESKELLLAAIDQAVTAGGGQWPLLSLAKQQMLRIDPTFDEANHGFESFSAFLKAFGDTVQIDQGRVIPVDKRRRQVATPEAPTTRTTGADGDIGEAYARTLKRQQYKLLSFDKLALLAESLVAANREGTFATFEQMIAELRQKADASISDSDVNRFRQIVFKNHAFELLGESGVRLDTRIGSADQLIELILRNTLRRLISDPDFAWDPRAAARLFFGERFTEKQFQRVLQAYEQVEDESTS